jgi:hypothetical protein
MRMAHLLIFDTHGTPANGNSTATSVVRIIIHFSPAIRCLVFFKGM